MESITPLSVPVSFAFVTVLVTVKLEPSKANLPFVLTSTLFKDNASTPFKLIIPPLCTSTAVSLRPDHLPSIFKVAVLSVAFTVRVSIPEIVPAVVSVFTKSNLAAAPLESMVKPLEPDKLLATVTLPLFWVKPSPTFNESTSKVSFASSNLAPKVALVASKVRLPAAML